MSIVITKSEAFMVVLLFLFSSLLFSGNSMQDGGSSEINVIDEKGNKQGKWKVFDDSGLYVLEEGFYKDDMKEGLWYVYYADGAKKSEITYVSGEPNGKASFFYDNGKVRESGIWKDDHWVGEYKYYYKSGQLSYDWKYNLNGKREGEQLYFHKNGNKMYEGNWIAGKTHGTLKVYNDSGVLVEEKVYENGVVSKVNKVEKSISKTDDSIPNLRFKGTGNHTVFRSDGSIDFKGYFENGVLINGEKFNYNENNKLISITKYRNGKKIEE